MKQTQAAVRYRRGYPIRQCSVCSMYTHGTTGKQFGGCTAVTGQITPYGLCNLFNQLNNPYGNKMPAICRREMERYYDQCRGDVSA